MSRIFFYFFKKDLYKFEKYSYIERKWSIGVMDYSIPILRYSMVPLSCERLPAYVWKSLKIDCVTKHPLFRYAQQPGFTLKHP